MKVNEINDGQIQRREFRVTLEEGDNHRDVLNASGLPRLGDSFKPRLWSAPPCNNVIAKRVDDNVYEIAYEFGRIDGHIKGPDDEQYISDVRFNTVTCQLEKKVGGADVWLPVESKGANDDR